MGRKEIYTKEQIHTMKMNPYTHSVNAYQITFTLEFKEFFVDQIRNHRKNAPQILSTSSLSSKYICCLHTSATIYLRKLNVFSNVLPYTSLNDKNKVGY